MSVTELYQNYCIIPEGVSQPNAHAGKLVKTKKEWNYIHLPRVIIDDGERDQNGSLVLPQQVQKVLTSFASGI